MSSQFTCKSLQSALTFDPGNIHEPDPLNCKWMPKLLRKSSSSFAVRCLGIFKLETALGWSSRALQYLLTNALCIDVWKTKTTISFIELPIILLLQISDTSGLQWWFLRMANKLFSNSFEAIISKIKLMVKRLMPWKWSCRRREQKIIKQFWGKNAGN